MTLAAIAADFRAYADWLQARTTDLPRIAWLRGEAEALDSVAAGVWCRGCDRPVLECRCREDEQQLIVEEAA